MTLIDSILEWFERITSWAIVRVLTMLYPELRLARDDNDRALAASGLGPLGIKHSGLVGLAVILIVLAAIGLGTLGAVMVVGVTSSWSRPLQTIVAVVGFSTGFAVPFAAAYLLTRRSRRQIHLEILRGLDAVICPSCGYSMRGHSLEETVLCPECGTSMSNNHDR